MGGLDREGGSDALGKVALVECLPDLLDGEGECVVQGECIQDGAVGTLDKRVAFEGGPGVGSHGGVRSRADDSLTVEPTTCVRSNPEANKQEPGRLRCTEH